MRLSISETNAVLCSVRAIYWKHVTTGCAKWHLDLLWGYPRKSTACNSRVNYAHLLLCSCWLNLEKNLFKSRLKMEHVSHTVWLPLLTRSKTINSEKDFPQKSQTVNKWAGQWPLHRTTLSAGADTFLASGTCELSRKHHRSKLHPSLPLHLPSTYRVSFVSSRDISCEYFFKPRNSPSYIV